MRRGQASLINIAVQRKRKNNRGLDRTSMAQAQASRSLRSRLLLILIAVVVAAAALAAYFYASALLPAVNRVALIEIKGTLDYSQVSILGTTVGVEKYIELIKQAEEDPSVRAVLIVFDSPGGTVSASYDLYTAVKSLASKKVVVSYARGYMTSGAYMAACPSHRIYASPASLVGSVGAVEYVITYGGLLEKLGVRVYTVKSGSLKDIGSPFRNMTQEELEVMQSIVDEYSALFRRIVEESRGNVSEEVFTARPYAPQQALKVGLVDGVLTLEEAINRTKELAGLPPYAPVVELKPTPPSLLELLLGGGNTRAPVPIPDSLFLAMWPPPQAVVLPVTAQP